MKISIYGLHTLARSGGPCDQAKEFLAAMQVNWDAIEGFMFPSIHEIEVEIEEKKVIQKSLNDIFIRLALAVAYSGKAVGWTIMHLVPPLGMNVEKTFVPVPDDHVYHEWKCESKNCIHDNPTSEIPPTWYEEYGTPVCECGKDMTYQRTRVLK